MDVRLKGGLCGLEVGLGKVEGGGCGLEVGVG